MPSTLLHEIDPGGDLVVILKEPNTQKVVPAVPVAPPPGSTNRGFIPDQTIVNSPEQPSGLPPKEEDKEDESPVEIRFRVSSRHLMLASVNFKSMLSGPWKESQSVDSQASTEVSDASVSCGDSLSDGASPGDQEPSNLQVSHTPCTREVSTTGWNAHALLTVFNIIHGKCSEVPRSISLEFFTEVAVIANYYQCAEALSLAADSWFYNNFKSQPKYQFGRGSVMLLFVAWVFSRKETFSTYADVVVTGGHGLGLVETYDLPIAGILDALDKERVKAIHSLLSELKGMTGKLLGDQLGCSHTCRSMLIGSLAREYHRSPYLNKEGNYIGLSLDTAIKTIDAFRAVNWAGHQCSAKKLMQPAIKKVKDEISTISLADFQH